jgi:hypothetical protein
MIIKNINSSILNNDIALSGFFYPDQFVTAKQRNSKAYLKKVVDYFSSIAFMQLDKKKLMVKNYKLRNGEFDFKDYSDSAELRQIDEILHNYDETEFSYLRHYPIINSPLNTLKGELIGRPRRERVKAIDAVSASEVLEYRSTLINQEILKRLQAKFAPQAQQDENGEPQLPEEYYKELSAKMTNYTTAAETWGNKALTAFKHYFNFSEKNEDGFMDFLTAGEEYHHIYPDNSKIGFKYKVENPINVWYLGSANVRYTTECWAVGTLELMSISNILDEYNLDKDEIEQLTAKSVSMDGNVMYTTQTPTLPDPTLLHWSMNYSLEQLADATLLNSLAFGNQQYHAVVKCYWKGKKKIFKRIYLDDEGYQRFEYVDESYKMDEKYGDLELQESWINQWYKATRIGPYVYKEIEELEFNETCPIVGIVNHTKNTKGKSLLDLMKGYQAAYNVCMNQIWDLLSKEIGVVFLGDLKLVPKKNSDNPIEEWMFEARERGVVFVDSSIENTGGNVQFNQVSRVDLTRSMEIQTRMQLAQALRSECWELIGISRQRVGSILASESATGTNAALSQSFSQTEPWFKFHEDLMVMVIQTALNVMQFVELRKPESILNYLNSDLDNVFFKINRQELLRNLHVYATNSKEDKDRVEMLKQLLQPAMQNGAELMDAVQILSADSENRIKDVLSKIQERKEKQQKQMQDQQQQEMQMKQQQFEQQQQMLMQQQQDKMMNDNQNAQADRETKIRIAEIQALGFEKNDIDNSSDIMQASKNALDASRHEFDKLIKMKEMQQEDRRMDIDEKQIVGREEVARMRNKNKKK